MFWTLSTSVACSQAMPSGRQEVSLYVLSLTFKADCGRSERGDYAGTRVEALRYLQPTWTSMPPHTPPKCCFDSSRGDLNCSLDRYRTLGTFVAD